MALITPINILLLGDRNVGKSTLLSRIAAGPSESNPSTYPEPIILNLRKPQGTVLALCTLDIDTLHEEQSNQDNPHHDSNNHNADTNFHCLLQEANVLILCYSTSSIASLSNIKYTYQRLLGARFNVNEDASVMLLGLQRDLRRAPRATSSHGALEAESVFSDDASRCTSYETDNKEGSIAVSEHETISRPPSYHTLPPSPPCPLPELRESNSDDRSVMPQEGLSVAHELRLDRYAECSALTGQLMREVWEDIVGMCCEVVKQRQGGGGRGAEGSGGDGDAGSGDEGWGGCLVM